MGVHFPFPLASSVRVCFFLIPPAFLSSHFNETLRDALCRYLIARYWATHNKLLTPGAVPKQFPVRAQLDALAAQCARNDEEKGIRVENLLQSRGPLILAAQYKRRSPHFYFNVLA